MKHKTQVMRGFISIPPFAAGVLLAIVSLIGIVFMPDGTPLADMRIEPTSGVVHKDEPFVIQVIVSAEVPVNVFKGELTFDHRRVQVQSIDYNTSIADLWAEKPWYENGDGTLNFIGGTTREGGFLGTGSLMTITFVPIDFGPAHLTFIDARILAHDGLGSDVPVKGPIDALFSVNEEIIASETVASPKPRPAAIAIVRDLPSTDLNGDGKQSIADVSIFMVNMMREGDAYDFNGDGAVNIKDASILLGAE